MVLGYFIFSLRKDSAHCHCLIHILFAPATQAQRGMILDRASLWLTKF
jgi:hypothetical protein